MTSTTVGWADPFTRKECKENLAETSWLQYYQSNSKTKYRIKTPDRRGRDLVASK